jgi:hypothetical protein
MKEDLSVGSDMDDDDSDSAKGDLDESQDMFDESMKNTEGILGKGLNQITDNKLMKGLGSGIGMIGKGMSGLAGFNQEGEEEDRSDEKSPAELKKIFMDKYSVQLEIPSQDI